MTGLKSIYVKTILLQLFLWVIMLCVFYFYGGFETDPKTYFLNPGYLILMGLTIPFSLLLGRNVHKTNTLSWGKIRSIPVRGSHMVIQLLFMSILWYSMVIAAAMPIYGKEKAMSSKANLELIICLDISKSMNVRDMQGSSRLDVAKRVISSLLSKSSGEQIGLCIFAGNAVREIELTRDYQLIRTVTSNIESELIEQQGTDIGAAFLQAREMFSSALSGKSILLITDGENHEQDEQDNGIYTELKKEEVYTCILGLGSAKGGPIPTNTLTDDQINLTDDNGTEWISKLGEESIKAIADKIGGSVIISNQSYPDIDPILTQINLMKREKSRTLDTDVEAMRYKWFIYLGFISFIMLMLIPVLWKK